MTLLRSFILVLTLVIGAYCIYGIGSILAPVLTKEELSSVSAMILLFWFSVEFGVFAGHQLWHEYRSKKIQKELDMERAFRKMGDSK
jgi:hypothetical protein